MKVKMKIRNCLVLLSLFYLPFGVDAKVKIESTSSSITVSTDEVGVPGFRGCSTDKLNEVPAYVYVLLYKEKGDKETDCEGEKGDGGTRSFHSAWEEVNRLASNESTASFEQLPEGRYKVEVLVGQAIGCLITGGDESMPARSIVYLQEKTNPFVLGSKKETNQEPLAKTKVIPQNILEVFPNPASNQIQIHLHSPDLGAHTEIVLYDLLGRAMIQKKESTQGLGKKFNWTMDVGQFSDGAYLLVVKDEEGHSFQQKIIVQRD